MMDGGKFSAWTLAPPRRDILDRVLAQAAGRGLRGIKLVVSDATKASRPVIEGADRQLATLPRPLHAQCARSSRQERAAPCLRFIATAFAQDDAGAARLQWCKVADQLRPLDTKTRQANERGRADVLAFMSFPTSAPD
jgi:transposase-like protein